LSVEISDGAEATEALGARIAAGLGPGDVVLIAGELGSGKTTLVRGACRALGVSGPVASPTFTIGRRHRGRVPVSHLDLYRLDDLGLEDPALLDDYLTPDAIAFVEWPESAREAPLGEGVAIALRIELRHAGGDRREVEVRSPADAGDRFERES
jgi:tRNA threonylcarbamoyladenosine biosynthesis protein TsaE